MLLHSVQPKLSSGLPSTTPPMAVQTQSLLKSPPESMGTVGSLHAGLMEGLKAIAAKNKVGHSFTTRGFLCVILTLLDQWKNCKWYQARNSWTEWAHAFGQIAFGASLPIFLTDCTGGCPTGQITVAVDPTGKSIPLLLIVEINLNKI